jgi:hypothetical protein
LEQEAIFINLLVQNIHKCETNNKNQTINNNKAIIKINNTGLFEMIVGVLTACHTQYT